MDNNQVVNSHSLWNKGKRIVQSWIAEIGLNPLDYGTHSLRRTKSTLIYKRTNNLRSIQLMLGLVTQNWKAPLAIWELKSMMRWSLRNTCAGLLHLEKQYHYVSAIDLGKNVPTWYIIRTRGETSPRNRCLRWLFEHLARVIGSISERPRHLPWCRP